MRKDVTIDDFIEVLHKAKEEHGNIKIGTVIDITDIMNQTEEQFIRYKYSKSLQYDIQLITNELTLKSDDEMQKQKKDEKLTFYSPWGHYETLGKVDVVDEWKRESPGPYFIQGILEEMMGKNVSMWNKRATLNCEDTSLLGELLEEYKKQKEENSNDEI